MKFIPGQIAMSVDVLKVHVGPEIAAKLDKIHFDWQAWIDSIPSILEAFTLVPQPK
jgi:hypothetical protein